MVSFKIKSSWYKDLIKMLKEVGAVDAGGKQSYPQYTYINPKDMKHFRWEVKLAFKKQYKYLSKKALDTSVAMWMLNYSPAECSAIKEGYILVDTYSIKQSMGLEKEGI